MKLRITLLASVFLVLSATPANAQSRDRDIDVRHLDDDVVQDVQIPILFGVSLDQVVPDFGAPRGGGTRQHEGQDFIAPRGAPTISPTEAVVTSIGNGESSGRYVYTRNPGGETFRYMHLDEIADIKRGDRIEQGSFIGMVGDTGNAAPGSYHLHFEIRRNRQPVDPYPRLVDTWSFKEKIALLPDIVNSAKDPQEYAETLVRLYPNEIARALDLGYKIPRQIERALDRSVIEEVAVQQKIRTALAVVPSLLVVDLKEGDSGPAVQLLQLYLMFYGSGASAVRLQSSGPTGYFGSITRDALLALQSENSVQQSGVYDAKTRTALTLAR